MDHNWINKLSMVGCYVYVCSNCNLGKRTMFKNNIERISYFLYNTGKFWNKELSCNEVIILNILK